MLGNKIVYVGDDVGVAVWRGPHTRVVQGNGRSLLPGFIDSHFHLMHGAEGLDAVQLYEVTSLAELSSTVREFAAANPQAPWVRGQGLRYGIPADGPLTRHHLDAMEPERPLALVAYDGHTVWANTAALKAAGLLKHTTTAGVMIDDDGLPSGELREEPASGPLYAAIPKLDDARRRQLMQQALAYLASLGVTSVHNMDGDAEQTAFYAALEDLGELTLRVYMPYSVRPNTPLTSLEQEAAAMKRQFQSDMVRAGSVKFFMDGVYESYTAVTLEGYPDQPQNHGEPIYDTEHFASMAVEADRLGLQIIVHACGDGAVRRVLDGYETVQATNGRRDSRHRVEHIEVIHPDDVPRFAQLGVVASMQPVHAPDQPGGADIWPARVREEAWERAFAWRTLRAAGAVMAFGSDWPVALPDPLVGIADAVNRRPWREGQQAQSQTLEEAIAGYTRDAAYAEFQEGKKGQIKVGQLADLVLLTDNIFAVPAKNLATVRAAMTICNGRIVYERP